MEPRDDVFETLVRSLPDVSTAIEQGYEQSAEFRSICEDYFECIQALRYWEETSCDDADVRREEYRGLLRELEQEVLTWLKRKDLL